MKKIENKYKEVKSILIKSSQKVSNFINFEERFGDLISQTMKENDSTQLRELLMTELTQIANKNINYIRLYYERTLQMNPDDENIWENFVITSQQKEYKVSNKQYLTILQRACKCCYFNVNFWILLLREMEKQGLDKQDIESKIIFKCRKNIGSLPLSRKR
jgi:UDP:flavonoid glycosyltransferase YjiC (YdhE family)